MVFQTEFIAKMKNRHNKPDYIPDGQKYVPCWPYIMTAHGLVHGGLIFLVTGVVWLGVIETVSHIAIDMLKCDNFTNPNQDQLLHYIMKAIYILIMIFIIGGVTI